MVKQYLVNKLKQFRYSRTGIAYIWVVGIATLAIGSLLFWVLGIFMDAFASDIFGAYAFSGFVLQGWIFVKALAAYGLPLVVICTVLLWSWVQSKMSRYDE